MAELRSFEKEAVRLLAGGVLPGPVLEAVAASTAWALEQQSPGGYYLRLRRDGLPLDRVVCSQPAVSGTAGDVVCGFVVFIEDEELTLECHSWGPGDVPSDFREYPVEVRAAA